MTRVTTACDQTHSLSFVSERNSIEFNTESVEQGREVGDWQCGMSFKRFENGKQQTRRDWMAMNLDEQLRSVQESCRCYSLMFLTDS